MKQKNEQNKALTAAEFEQQLRARVKAGDALACYQIVDYFERKGLAANKLEAQNRINLLLEASNHNISAASLLLGRWYLNGRYVNKDPAKAIMFFEHAANVCKDSYGYYHLAEMFQTGNGVNQQAEKGLEYLKKAVKMHNPDATFTYANQLLQTDVDQAFQLFKDNYKNRQHIRSLFCINDAKQFNQDKVMQFFQSNHEGDVFVSALLAARYLQQKNIEWALPLATFSAEMNNPIGCYIRALIELERENGDINLAKQFMLRAAQTGHIEAAYRVGMGILQQAEQQTDRNVEAKALQQALQFIAQAAHAGLASAQFTLGQCWLQGLGVERNVKEGQGWLERAAKQGHIDATFALAMSLPVEHPQHLRLLQVAAQAGHAKALLCMGIYEQNQKRPKNAITWFEHALSRGETRANLLLGLAYRDGLGIEVDAKRAVELLNEANDANGYFALYETYRDGLGGVRKNKKSQAKYLKLAKEHGHPQALSIDE